MRIVAAVVALAALGLAAAGAAAYAVASARISEQVDAAVARDVGAFRALAATGVDPQTGRPYGSLRRLFEGSLQQLLPPSNGLLAGIEGGTVQFVQVGALDVPPADYEAAVRPDDGFGTVETSLGPLRYGVVAVEVAGDPTPGRFLVGVLVERERAVLADAARAYAALAVLALVVVAVGGWLVAGRLLAPVRDVRRAAQQISESDLTRRIPVRGRDDVSELARTFNAMLDRLEEAFAAQREFLDDAGHELRTPLTIVRGHLELLDAADPADVVATRTLVLDELDRMGRLVDDLILLAKAQRPDFVVAQDVDTGRLLDEVYDKVRTLGERHWTVDACADTVVRGDPQRLTQALVQLAGNAVAHTAAGDEVALGCATGLDATGRPVVRWWVRDTGPGFPKHQRVKAFERFARGADAPDEQGSGLGLAIVRAIAEAHGGTARIDDAPGGGAIVTLELPGGRAAVTAGPFDPLGPLDEEPVR